MNLSSQAGDGRDCGCDCGFDVWRGCRFDSGCECACVCGSLQHRIAAVPKNKAAKSGEAALAAVAEKVAKIAPSHTDTPSKSTFLAAVAEKVVECRACERLVAWREDVAEKKRAAYKGEEYWGRPVPGFGDPEARVVLIGLAPGAHGANRTGRMFTGDRSGDWLYRALWQTGFANQPKSARRDDGLELTGAYITAPVKCAPPANKPTTEERDNCHPFLAQELAALTEAKVFVALGSFAAREVAAFFNLKPRPKFGHGACYSFYLPAVPASSVSASSVSASSVSASYHSDPSFHPTPANNLPSNPKVPASSHSDPSSSRQTPPKERKHLVCSYHPSQQNTFTGKLTEEMLRAVFEQARSLAGY